MTCGEQASCDGSLWYAGGCGGCCALSSQVGTQRPPCRCRGWGRCLSDLLGSGSGVGAANSCCGAAAGAGGGERCSRGAMSARGGLTIFLTSVWRCWWEEHSCRRRPTAQGDPPVLVAMRSSLPALTQAGGGRLACVRCLIRRRLAGVEWALLEVVWRAVFAIDAGKAVPLGSGGPPCFLCGHGGQRGLDCRGRGHHEEAAVARRGRHWAVQRSPCHRSRAYGRSRPQGPPWRGILPA